MSSTTSPFCVLTKHGSGVRVPHVKALKLSRGARSKIRCAPGWTRTSDAHWAGDLQSPVIAAIRPARGKIVTDFLKKRNPPVAQRATGGFLTFNFSPLQPSLSSHHSLPASWVSASARQTQTRPPLRQPKPYNHPPPFEQ